MNDNIVILSFNRNFQEKIIKSFCEHKDVDINIIKAFKYRDVKFIPIDDIMPEYKNISKNEGKKKY